MATDQLIMWLALSVMVNMFVIFVSLFTGVGMDSWRRFMNKKKHRRGGWAYSLMATKDGNIEEVFAKVADGKFKHGEDEKSYTRDPSLTRNFRGIPAHFHLQDTPSPIDPWASDKANYLLSCAEMDTVMNAQQSFDLKEWIKQNKGMAIILGVVFIGLVAASTYFGYIVYQAVQDGTIVCTAKVVAQAIAPSVPV